MSVPRDDHRMAFIRHVRHIDGDRRTLKYKNVSNETPSVAQAVFALLLELTNHVGHHARTVHEGRWTASEDFVYWDIPIYELAGEQALADALNDGRIAGAGLDVLSSEQPTADNPLLTANNCIITPHQAWASEASRRRLLGEAAANLRAFIDGSEKNVVA